MPDEIDQVQRARDLENEAHVKIALREAAKIPAGVAGICDECQEHKPRLVAGRCAPCRDGR